MSRADLFNIIEYDDEHQSKWSTFYDILMIVMIVLSLIPLMFRGQKNVFVWFDQVSVVVFMLDYLLRWATADLKRLDKNRFLSFALYPLTPMAILDLLSILPSLGIFGRWFKVLRIFRLLKTLCHFKLSRRYTSSVQYKYNDSDESTKATPLSKKDYYAEGVEYFNAGDYSKAMEFFQEAIEAQPNHESAHYKLAETYIKLENVKHAEKTLFALLAINPNHKEAFSKVQALRGIDNNKVNATVISLNKTPQKSPTSNTNQSHQQIPATITSSQSQNIQPILQNDPVIKLLPPSGSDMKYYAFVQKSGNRLYFEEAGRYHLQSLHSFFEPVHKPTLNYTLHNRLRSSTWGFEPERKEIPKMAVKLVPPTASTGWKGYMKPQGVLVIPDTVKIMKIGQQGMLMVIDNQNKYGYKEDKIITVTEIGDGAFASNKSITDIVIPETVFKIGRNAFINTDIKSIFLPDSITEIGDGAFSYCKLLSSVKLSNNLCKIGRNAFNNTCIKDIVIPDNVNFIDNGAFMDCKFLSSVKLPKKVKSISSETFVNTQLTFLDIPEGITSIGSKAFSGIETIRVHSKPFTIWEDSFGYNRITHVNVEVPASYLSDYQNARFWQTMNLIPY